MKRYKYSRFIISALPALCALTLTSCFKEEPLNAECDIVQAYVESDDQDYLAKMFFNNTDAKLNITSTTTDIKFTVRRNADLSAVAPKFVLTPGATINPPSGSQQYFALHTPCIYTVTSEDGKYHRDYSVSFSYSNDVYEYYFDHYELKQNKYYEWSDVDDNGQKLNNWASGNVGYSITPTHAKPEEYPTSPASDGILHPTCVKLTTCDTGTYGKNMKMPIAAGNMFLGRFVIEKALVPNDQGVRGVLATEFGYGNEITAKPISFSGSYRYERGTTFTDKNKNVVEGRKDFGSIYAVVYKNHTADGKAFVLHGDDVLTSDQIVARAIVNETNNSSVIDQTIGWVPFNVNFVYAESIDPQLLANRGYSLTIVSSSSNNGASFEGAIGSTLWIDDYNIKCEE